MVWGEAPPATARTIVHGCVSRIRGLLNNTPTQQEQPPRLHTRSPGYVLTVESDRVDVHRARLLIDQAHNWESAERSRMLSIALQLWRGPMLSDLPDSPLNRGAAPQFDELRLAALEQRVGVDLDLGRHDQLVLELPGLVEQYPLRERLTGQLMLAHYRCGHRAQAQNRFHALRTRLSYDLGIDPGPELRDLYER